MSEPADTTGARAHLWITGLVQGVYYRASAAHEARALGLSGWIQNTGQGVEAVFEGPRHSVERMIRWCRQGPPRASVDDVTVEWGRPEGLNGFVIRG